MNAICSRGPVLSYVDESNHRKSIEEASSQDIRSVYNIVIACDPRRIAAPLSLMLRADRIKARITARSNEAILHKVASIQKIIRAIDPDSLPFSPRLMIPDLKACSHSKANDLLHSLKKLRFDEILGSRIWLPKWLNKNEKDQFIAYIFMALGFKSAFASSDYVTQSKHTAHPCETKQA